MSVDFKTSETHINLMRAFAGESQARNRYTFAADAALKQNLYVIHDLFNYTANQERAHAHVFMGHLTQFNGETIDITAGYPAETTTDILELLKFATHNEQEEHGDVYPKFAKIATEEGFPQIAQSFTKIADIEKTHGERFKLFADYMEQDRLFKDDENTPWMCLNCGTIHYGKEAPAQCTVCHYNQGYFLRQSQTYFSK